MKNRLVRVGEVIRRELGQIVERDLSLRESLVTVQHVDLTPDLRHCHVYVSVLGAEDGGRSVITKLESDRAAIQRALAKRVIIKYTPRLHFKLDHSIKRGDRIIQVLSELDLPEEPAQIPEHADDLDFPEEHP